MLKITHSYLWLILKKVESLSTSTLRKYMMTMITMLELPMISSLNINQLVLLMGFHVMKHLMNFIGLIHLMEMKIILSYGEDLWLKMMSHMIKWEMFLNQQIQYIWKKSYIMQAIKQLSMALLMMEVTINLLQMAFKK